MVIIKKAQKPMKERRTRVKPETVLEVETKKEPAIAENFGEVKKEKVELKDIEQQLDELLG